MRNTPWTERFLRHVWNHNDGGAGESDQRSFKAMIDELTPDQRSAHVKFYAQVVIVQDVNEVK